MTRTFNSESYGKLLAKYQPKTITTEEENEEGIRQLKFGDDKIRLCLQQLEKKAI